MRILYIDPWCADGSNLYYYSTGLVGAISKYADVTMVCQKHCKIPSNSSYHYINIFFPFSFKMKRGMVRRIIRGVEYIYTYCFIMGLAKKEKYDVIHIEWPLLYDVDIRILKRLKGMCKLLSLKAHNVLPHSTGSAFVKKLEKIYSLPDIILVHGKYLKNQLISLFPECSEKVYIQKHGLYMNHDRSFDLHGISKSIQNRIDDSEKIYLFFGRIDKDKGADRLIKIWNDSFKKSNSLLIIAGKVDEAYDFSESERIINTSPGILYISGFIEDNLLNYLIDSCNIIVLPYRDGSMSGVVFTAAEFSKPVLTTKFGAIDEYILNGENSIIINNCDDSIRKALQEIEEKSIEDMSELGNRLHDHFENNYSWENIGRELINETFANYLHCVRNDK